MSFGLSLNLSNLAASQYRNFDFNSMCMFNGKPIAFNSEGIFSLDDAETDNGVEINSFIEFPISDLGILSRKRFRKLYVGYETSGSLSLTVIFNDVPGTPYTLAATTTGNLQHRGKLSMHRSEKGVYCAFRIENISGCDFSLDNLVAIVNVLARNWG